MCSECERRIEESERRVEYWKSIAKVLIAEIESLGERYASPPKPSLGVFPMRTREGG